MSHAPLLLGPEDLLKFNKIVVQLTEILQSVPLSRTQPSLNPERDARLLIRRTAMQIGLKSGALALPAGPLGLLLTLPAIAQTVVHQKQLVADIAGLYGVEQKLNPAVIGLLLFESGSVKGVEKLALDLALKNLSTAGAKRAVQQLLKRFAISVTQKTIGSATTRLLPIAGALITGVYVRQRTVAIGQATLGVCHRLTKTLPEPFHSDSLSLP